MPNKSHFWRAQRQYEEKVQQGWFESLKPGNFADTKQCNRWQSCVLLQSLSHCYCLLLSSPWVRSSSKKWQPHPIITLGRVDLVVQDELPKMAPSKARKKRHPKKKSHLPRPAEIAREKCEDA
jgi:hypothetical protein